MKMKRTLAVITEMPMKEHGYILSIGTLYIHFHSFEKMGGVIDFYNFNHYLVARMTLNDYKLMFGKLNKLVEIK
jgi:hypothetical protein